MATVNLDDVIVMKDSIIEIDADDYAAAVSSATLTPSAASVTWKGLKSTSSFTRTGRATWTLDLEFAQDWTSLTSLGRYLLDHEGETVAATIKPQDDPDQTGFEVDINITPGAIGGAVDGVAVSTVSLGSSRPVPIDPA